MGGFYPIDGALGMKEIVDVLEEQDYLVEHSALIDEGAMTGASLKPPIQEECSASFIRRVTPTKLTTEQASILEEGRVVLLPQIAKAGCTLRKALISTSAKSSWYWPNTDTGSEVALKKTIHDVKQLSCCPEQCCETVNPGLCLCDKINNRKSFLDCLGRKLFATCDNTMKVYFDGKLQEVDEAMTRWDDTSLLTIPAQTRVLAIECQDLGAQEGILASTEDGLVTGSTWQCSNQMVDGWTQPGFVPPQGTFSQPTLLGSNGVDPWGVRPDILGNAEWIWPQGSSDWAGCRIELKP